jgi:hypothetical protein
MLSLILFSLFAQDITIPPEIRVAPNNFIIISPETKGTHVEWVTLTPGLIVLDPAELADKKKFVAVAPAGIYKILAYTATGDKPSKPVFSTIIVGSAPDNISKFQKDIKNAYTSDSSPDKAGYKQGFIDGFTEVLASVENCKTVNDLNNLVASSLKDKSPGQGDAVKQLIRDHLRTNFGSAGSANLDQIAAKKVLNEILAALGGL